MSPFGGRSKASSPNPHDFSSIRGEGMHSSPITPPSAARGKSMSSSPGTGGWRSRNDGSSFPPRGAESDTFRSRALGGGPVYPQWLASDGGNVMDLTDPFPSMWCCALFLHVHPKKQHRALSLLVALQDKSALKSSFSAMVTHTAMMRTDRGMSEKAGRHYIFGMAFKVMRRWNSRATALKVARMRLRTSVARWLRVQLQETFEMWKQERTDVRELIVSAERVAEKTLASTLRHFFETWVGIMDAQEHKREVLTRILLRIQDRTSFKALHALFAVTTHINRCRVQAERGLAKHRHIIKEVTFVAWQDLRSRGLRAIQMMDSAFARWNRELLGWSLQSMQAIARRKMLIRRRSMWLVVKEHHAALRDALHGWSKTVGDQKRLRNIGGIILGKSLYIATCLGFTAWMGGSREVRRLRLAAARVTQKSLRLKAGVTFSGWVALTTQGKVFVTGCERAMAKREVRMACHVINTWRGEVERASCLVELHERVLSRCNNQRVSMCWLGWREMWLHESTVRTRGVDAFGKGKCRGMRSGARALQAWHAFTNTAKRIQGVSLRIYATVGMRRAVTAWALEARRLCVQVQRFERMRVDCDRRMLRRFLDDWTAVHDRDIGRGNKLMKALAAWDTKCCSRTMDAWVAWWQRHVKAFKMYQLATGRQQRAAGSLAMELWSHSGLGERLLRLKAGRLQSSMILRLAKAAIAGWTDYVKASKCLFTREIQISEMSARNCLVRAWAGWSMCTEDTNRRARAISRMAARSQTARVRQSITALHVMVAQDKVWRAKLGNTVDRHERRVLRGVWGLWGDTVKLARGLEALRARAMERLEWDAEQSCWSMWQRLTLDNRALATKARVIQDRHERRACSSCLGVWSLHALRVRRLRAGVQLLIARQAESASRKSLHAWSHYASTCARNLHVAIASLERIQFNLKARAYREWDAFSVSDARKCRGVTALATRVCNAAVHEHVLFWRAAASQLVHGRSSAARMWLSTCPATLAWALGGWAGETGRLKTIRERCERMVEKSNRDLFFFSFDRWSVQYHLIKSRVEGFDRCESRYVRKLLRYVVDSWSGLATYSRRLRHTAAVTSAKTAHAARSQAMDHLVSVMKCTRKFQKMVRRRDVKEQERALSGWLAYTVAVEKKRRGLQRIMQRWEAGVMSACISAWKKVSDWLRSSRGRAALVESRKVAAQVDKGVAMLLKNSRTVNRYRRLRAAFDTRWYRHRLRSHFEAWRYWHGKKMAVKGVLDQMVDMM